MGVRDTRWIIALGVCIGIIGAILFIANGNDHSICGSALTAGEAGCSAANGRYNAGIVGMVAGGLLFAVGMITYRPGTPEERKNREAPVRWNHVVVGVVGLLALVVVVVVVFSYV
jgi:drug/metabolite transporter (DMT)-like permease